MPALARPDTDTGAALFGSEGGTAGAGGFLNFNNAASLSSYTDATWATEHTLNGVLPILRITEPGLYTIDSYVYLGSSPPFTVTGTIEFWVGAPSFTPLRLPGSAQSGAYWSRQLHRLDVGDEIRFGSVQNKSTAAVTVSHFASYVNQLGRYV